jgi:hypothetical protein
LSSMASGLPSCSIRPAAVWAALIRRCCWPSGLFPAQRIALVLAEDKRDMDTPLRRQKGDGFLTDQAPSCLDLEAVLFEPDLLWLEVGNLRPAYPEPGEGLRAGLSKDGIKVSLKRCGGAKRLS